jgi:hypothetical protein
MMYLILCKVRYETLHHVFRERKIWLQIGFSIVVNWIVAPLVMICLSLELNCQFTLPILIYCSLALYGRFFPTSQVCEKAWSLLGLRGVLPWFNSGRVSLAVIANTVLSLLLSIQRCRLFSSLLWRFCSFELSVVLMRKSRTK